MGKMKMPIPQWAIDDSISENDPLMRHQSAALVLPPSDENDQAQAGKFVISCEEDTKTDSDNSLSDGSDGGDRRGDGLLPHSDVDEDEQSKQDNKISIDMNVREKKTKKQKKQAPVAYTGFDDVSKENASKIHGDLMQRYFHENPEDIEGHGEETALLALQQAVQESEKAIVQ